MDVIEMAEGATYKHEHKTPIPGWVVAAIVIVVVIAGVANFLLPILTGEGDSTSADIDGTGMDVGQSVKPNQPVAVETETANSDTEPTVSETSGLKLLKKVGPVEFPPYDAKVDGRALIAQTEEIKIEGFHILAGANSRRDVSVSIVNINPEKRIVVLALLKDKQGNAIKSLCKKDEETGSPYFFKESFRKFGMHDRPSYAVSLLERKPDKLKDVHSWEVLVYIG